MAGHEKSEHFLLVRPDFDDPDTFHDGLLTLHTLATTRDGEDIHDFLLEVDGIGIPETTSENTTLVKIMGRLLTGEGVVCTLSYDDNDFTQMLVIEPGESSAA